MANPVLTRRLQWENHHLPLQHRQAVGPPLQPAHLGLDHHPAHQMTHCPVLMTHHQALMTPHHHPALVVRHPVQMEDPLHPVLTVR